jgi:hypothetical protein
MSSLRRINASIENGRRSQGPVTAQGKLRSSQNAIRHGLLAKAILLDTESADNFQQLHDQFTRRFQPADDVEVAIVEDLVACMWRRRRACAIETHALKTAGHDIDSFQIDKITEGFKNLAAGSFLPLLFRYQTQLDREYHRALKNLQLLRTVLRNEPNPISEQSAAVAPEPQLDEAVAEEEAAPVPPAPVSEPPLPDPEPVAANTAAPVPPVPGGMPAPQAPTPAPPPPKPEPPRARPVVFVTTTLGQLRANRPYY